MPTTSRSLADLTGRVLLALIFLVAGFSKLGDIPGTMAYTASGGLPGVFAFAAIAIEIIGGLFVLVGYRTRWAALALALFCVVTGVLYHFVPAQELTGMEAQAQMTNFMKNLAIAGGFLVLASQGARGWSLDGRRALA